MGSPSHLKDIGIGGMLAGQSLMSAMNYSDIPFRQTCLQQLPALSM